MTIKFNIKNIAAGGGGLIKVGGRAIATSAPLFLGTVTWKIEWCDLCFRSQDMRPCI